MYSPKIREDLVPELYKIAKSQAIPMTKLVNGILNDFLNQREKLKLQQYPPFKNQECYIVERIDKKMS